MVNKSDEATISKFYLYLINLLLGIIGVFFHYRYVEVTEKLLRHEETMQKNKELITELRWKVSLLETYCGKEVNDKRK